MTGTLTSVEPQLAVSIDYELMKLIVKHYFDQKNNTFFKLKLSRKLLNSWYIFLLESWGPILSSNDDYTPHHASNVDIVAFITSYAHVKSYKNAILILEEKAMHKDTYRILYVSLTGEPLLDIYGTGDIGLWTNKGTLDDPFAEFICSWLKTYGYKIFLGRLHWRVKT